METFHRLRELPEMYRKLSSLLRSEKVAGEVISKLESLRYLLNCAFGLIITSASETEHRILKSGH